MDWNSFNRELQNRVSDPGTRYCLGIVYERLLDISKQIDACTEVSMQLASVMQNMVGLHEQFDDGLRALRKSMEGREKGVSVESVPLTNEDN